MLTSKYIDHTKPHLLSKIIKTKNRSQYSNKINCEIVKIILIYIKIIIFS